MNPLKLGHDFSLPAQVVTKTIAILGLRGSGKSNTATVIVEEMLDQNLPPVIIDPTDAWWGLRSKYPVIIFGGSHGDVPLQETDGKTIAEFVVAERVPVVLSLRHLRKNAQRRFVTEFCEEIYHLKGKDENRTSLTVVIDEAPLFVPQKVMGEQARVVGAVEDLIARGRNAGFGVILISQRSATVNKDVLTQSDIIITHRLTSPQDKKALSEWFEDNATTDKQREILASLADLPDGRAWVWAPILKVMEQVQFRRRLTFDSSATPELGKAIAAPKKLTEIDLDLLKTKMKETVEQAKLTDPKALQAQVKRLNGMVTDLQNAALAKSKPVEVVKHVEVPVINDEQIFAIKHLAQEAQQLASKADLLWNKAMEIERTVQARKTELEKVPPMRNAPPEFGYQKSVRVTEYSAPRALPGGSADDLEQGHPVPRNTAEIGTGGKRRMLVALAQDGKRMTTRRLSLLTGISASGGTWRTYLGDLRGNGFVDGGADSLKITEAGLAALGAYSPLPIGKELREYWIKKLGAGGKCRIFEVVCEAYPQSVSYQTVSRLTNISLEGGTWRTYLGELRGLELVEGRGELRACDDLFE